MTEPRDRALYDEAAQLVASWTTFTRATFQRRIGVGFATRDRLLIELEDNGRIVALGRDHFRTVTP